MKQPHIVVADILPSGIRPAGNDLHQRMSPVGLRPGRKKRPICKQILPAGIIPVLGKPHIQKQGCRARQFQVRIPPVSQFLIFSYILPSNIKPSDEACAAVYHNDFPMIPVIDPRLQTAQHRREKHAHLNAFLAQPFQILSPQLPGTHSIHQEPHLHACRCFFRQLLFQRRKHLITPYNIGKDVDVGLRRPDLRRQFPVQGLPFRKNLPAVVHREHRVRRLQIISDQTVKPGHFPPRHRPSRQCQQPFLHRQRLLQLILHFFQMKQLFPPVILSRQHIQKKPGSRHKSKHQQPGPQRFRILPLKKHQQHHEAQADPEKNISKTHRPVLLLPPVSPAQMPTDPLFLLLFPHSSEN